MYRDCEEKEAVCDRTNKQINSDARRTAHEKGDSLESPEKYRKFEDGAFWKLRPTRTLPSVIYRSRRRREGDVSQ